MSKPIQFCTTKKDIKAWIRNSWNCRCPIEQAILRKFPRATVTVWPHLVVVNGANIKLSRRVQRFVRQVDFSLPVEAGSVVPITFVLKGDKLI